MHIIWRASILYFSAIIRKWAPEARRRPSRVLLRSVAAGGATWTVNLVVGGHKSDLQEFDIYKFLSAMSKSRSRLVANLVVGGHK